MLEDSSRRYQTFEPWFIDYSKIVSGYNKTFYYDSLPPRKKEDDESTYSKRSVEQSAFFDSLRTINGVHVYEGDARRRKEDCSTKKSGNNDSCGYANAFIQANMHQAALLTADLDFKPLVDALVQDGMHVTLLYPHGKPNTELIYAADARQPLTFRNVYNWCTDDFQRTHPSPKAVSQPGKQIQGGFVVDTWPTAMDTTAELFETKDGFIVVFPSTFNLAPVRTSKKIYFSIT